MQPSLRSRTARRCIATVLAALGAASIVLAAAGTSGSAGATTVGTSGSAGATTPAGTSGSAGATTVAGRVHAPRSHRSPEAPATAHYLLALGDSLAAGYQPTDGTRSPPVDPATGHPDRGYPGSYAADVAAKLHLSLIDLACPGETTASISAAPAEPACGTAYAAQFGATSQLGAATAFLARHLREVSVVTFDLGANDIDGCASASGFSASCLAKGEAAVSKQLPKVLAALRRALKADDPGAELVAMNYYDPFLGVAYSPGGLLGTAGASLSVEVSTGFNLRIEAIYQRAGIPVADVASAFKTGLAVPLATYGGDRLPIDVVEICRWTWMCPLPGSGAKADIHANSTGYRVIATAFEALLAATKHAGARL